MKRLVLALLVVACGSSRRSQPPAQGSAGEVAVPEPAPAAPVAPSTSTPPPPPPVAATPSDAAGSAAAAGSRCTTVAQCPFVPDGSDCMYACIGGLCQLRGTTRTAGAGPCYGEMLAQAVMRIDVDPPPPQYLLCDAYAGLHCNRTTHVCERAKDHGAACEVGADCGLDGACDPNSHTCVEAPRIGQACVPGVTSCGREGFCDPAGNVCVPRVANGQPCANLGEQCQSAFCGFAGVGSKQMVCMPAAVMRHCPEVP